jgi:hypothetical protein
MKLSTILEEISDNRKPWELSREEFRKKYSKEWRNFIKPVAKKIRDKSSGNTPQKIVDFYINKYKISKPVTIEYGQNFTDNAEAETVAMGSGADINSYIIKVPYAENNNLSDEDVFTLRHEIEHILDMEKGFKSTQKKQQYSQEGLGDDKIKIGLPGHHKEYAQFETDYLHDQLSKDSSLRSSFEQNTI